jgi:hypothetical protein
LDGVNPNFQHTWLLKMTPDGDLAWSRRYSDKPANRFAPKAIAVTEEGVTVCAFATKNNPVPFPMSSYRAMLHTDYDGNIKWLRHFKDSLWEVTSLTAMPGGFIGTSNQALTSNGSNIFFKTDPLGYSGECTSIPEPLHFEDKSATVVPYAISSQPPYDDFPFDTLPVQDFPITLDTFCAPACPRGQEICNNNLDDDEDGLFDCLDPDCDCAEDVCAPKQANIWYFGNHAGLDFGTEPPTVLTDGATTDYAATSAVVCDAAGNLLFYADPQKAYNRFHEVMQNGDGLNFYSSTSLK